MPDLHDLFGRAVDGVPPFDAAGLRRVVARRRRRRVFVAAAIVVAVASGGGVVVASVHHSDDKVLIAPGDTTTSGSTPASTTPTPAPAPSGALGYPIVATHPEAFTGYGRLAYPSATGLSILDGTGASPRSIPLPGGATQVRWSPDGEWLAVQTRSGQTAVNGEGDLYVVRSDGTALTRVPVTTYSGEWEWSPARNLIAVGLASSRGYGTVALFAAPDFAHPVTTSIAGDLLAWSPDGTRLIVKTYAPATSFVDKVWSVDTSNCPPVCTAAPREIPVEVHIPAHTDMGFDFAGWSSDGQRLLLWLDAAHSGSVMLDGVAIASVSLDGGSQAELPGTLAKPSWIAVVPGTNRAILAAGGGRIWDSHRQLDSCDVTTGACTALVNEAGPTIDPAVSPDGRRLAYVATDHVVFANNAELPPKSSIRWTNSRRLVVAGVGNEDPNVIVADGVVAPRWAADSAHLVFWRAGYLWLVDADHPSPVAIVGQLEPRPDDFGFGPFAHAAYILPGNDVWDSVAWFQPKP